MESWKFQLGNVWRDLGIWSRRVSQSPNSQANMRYSTAYTIQIAILHCGKSCGRDFSCLHSASTSPPRSVIVVSWLAVLVESLEQSDFHFDFIWFLLRKWFRDEFEWFHIRHTHTFRWVCGICVAPFHIFSAIGSCLSFLLVYTLYVSLPIWRMFKNFYICVKGREREEGIRNTSAMPEGVYVSVWLSVVGRHIRQ